MNDTSMAIVVLKCFALFMLVVNVAISNLVLQELRYHVADEEQRERTELLRLQQEAEDMETF